tara:strand:+ start:1914 stop:2462 length:549 start_codon:yes stop_codon:yes gene_type:complete
MAAPKHVPTPPIQNKHYQSSLRKRSNSWISGRPAEQKSISRRNQGFGNQGPDQGYALKIVQYFRDRVYLSGDEEWHDVAEAAVLVGLKRASLFGRAPSRYDLEAAFCLWGYFDPEPDSDLVDFRVKTLKNLSATHNYLLRRVIADSIPVDKLKQELREIQESYQNNWRTLIDASTIQRIETL